VYAKDAGFECFRVGDLADVDYSIAGLCSLSVRRADCGRGPRGRARGLRGEPCDHVVDGCRSSVADHLGFETTLVIDERRISLVDEVKLQATAVRLCKHDGVAVSDRSAIIIVIPAPAPQRGRWWDHFPPDRL
jgi:hypothetical protein